MRIPEGADVTKAFTRMTRTMGEFGLHKLVIRRESRLYTAYSPGQRRRMKRAAAARGRAAARRRALRYRREVPWESD